MDPLAALQRQAENNTNKPAMMKTGVQLLHRIQDSQVKLEDKFKFTLQKQCPIIN
jgi:hypothetical protein